MLFPANLTANTEKINIVHVLWACYDMLKTFGSFVIKINK